MAKESFEGHDLDSNNLIIPVYRNEENIEDLLAALTTLDKMLEGNLEVVFVVDGSPDRSGAILETSLSSLSLKAQVVHHSRNFGSFAAIVTGLSSSSGRYCAVMAADLQEPVELVVDFFSTLRNPSVDIVVGVRSGRSDSKASMAMSRSFWWLFRTLVEPEIPPGGVDVFGCTRQVANVIISLPESNSSLIGLLYWIGFRRVEIGYERKPRVVGRSAWNFKRRVKYLTDSIFSFTTLPINVILMVGVLGSMSAVALGFGVLLSWLGGSIDQPGYTTLILVQLLSTSALLLAIGVVGTYVWRTFANTKNRPQAIVQDRLIK